uniref:Exported protein n=1 Tax=Strongyloides venezuelensis TaxID=75913 RepID=A0A0K0FGX2_STRVS
MFVKMKMSLLIFLWLIDTAGNQGLIKDPRKKFEMKTLGDGELLKMWKSIEPVNIKIKGYSFIKHIPISQKNFLKCREYQSIIGNDILKSMLHFNEMKNDVFASSDFDIGEIKIEIAPVKLNDQEFEKPNYYPVQE